MIKTASLFLTSFVMLLLFTGCVQRELVISDQRTGQNSWADEINIDEESIDISDLDENLTEKETMITEDMYEQKMERIAFPEDEYYHLPRRGKGTVKGAVYITDAYGQRVIGAGTRLYLNPMTSYSEQWYKESYLGGHKMEKADDRLFNYLRFTASNSEGKFAFYGVPSGNYYLIGTVKCGEECGYSRPKNIRIATQVSVYGNEVIEKDLVRILE